MAERGSCPRRAAAIVALLMDRVDLPSYGLTERAPSGPTALRRYTKVTPEIHAYIAEHRGSHLEIADQVEQLFGVRVCHETIYRIWRKSK